MAIDSDLVLTVTPTKLKFVQDEPVTLNVALSNRSSQAVEVFFDYPNDVGISFSCATAARGKSPITHGDKRIPVLSILPDGIHQFVLVLDRYLSIETPGKHVVMYSAEYLEPVTNERLRTRTFVLRGEFTLQIEEGGIAQADIDTIAKAIESQNIQHRREAIERLLWIKNAKVIAPLRAAARTEPRYGADIIRALGRLLPTADARKALSEVVLDGDACSVEAFLRLDQDTHMAIAEEEYRGLLSSRNPSVRLATLQHLVAAGNRSHFLLVRPLANDSNPAIKKLATEFVEKME
jgi:hypothetical protein